MKKKLALLLVLSMVLSMIPMNVFGATALNASARNVVSIVKKDTTTDHTAWINVPHNQFSPTATGVSLLLTISEGTFTSDMDTASSVEIAANGSRGPGQAYAAYGTGYEVQVYVAPDSTSTDLPIYFNGKNNEEDVTVKVQVIGTVGGVYSYLTSASVLVGTHYETGVWTINAGDKVQFADVAVLDDITISEKTRGVLAAASTLRFQLKLPDHYTWVNTSDTGFDYNIFIDTPTDVTYTGFGTRYLNVTISDITSTSTAVGIAEIYLKDLGVAADDKAKTGNVSVDVDVYGGPFSAGATGDKDSITVAQYGEYRLELTYADSKKTASYYELESGEYEVETAAFVLTELTPNSFPTSRNNSLQARFDMPEGVRLTEATITFEDQDEALIDDVTFPVGNTTNAQYGVKVNADSLVISPYVDRISYNNRLYTLTVQLTVSVEPGYEAEFGNDVAITLGGIALDNVKLVDANGKLITSKEFNIATVTDQIVLDVEEVEITLANAGQYAASEAVGDIIIEEAYEGALKQNTEVWVYVESTRVFDLAFVAGSVTADGLTISRATKLNITDLPVGIRFEILKESTKEPGKITISGGLITGLIYPGVDYKVIVSGNAVAASNEVVDYMENGGTGTTLATYVKTNPALFENSYNANLFKYAGGTYQPQIVDTNTAPATPAFTGVSLSTSTPVYMLSNGDPVTSPFVIPSDEPGKNVGYMSCSVFSELVGLTSVEWDPATGLATLTGVNKMTGQETVMVLENGKYTALVNGVEVGIYSGSAASVPVRNFNDRFYVPAKFAAEMFGLTVEWNTTTGIATFY